MKNLKRNILYCILALVVLVNVGCNTGYKTDDNKVYFTYWGSGSNTFEVLSADAKTFKVLKNNDYATDKDRAYYKGIEIPNSDPKSFTSIIDYYAKDNYHAYKGGVMIQDADGKSFEVISGGPYSKDKNDFYFDTLAMKADLKSFKILNEVDEYGYWSKDKNNYFILSKKHPLNDYESFKVLGNGYAKDKFKVYFEDSIVDGADPKTFKPTEYAFGADDHSKFNGRRKLNIEDPSSYTIIGNGFTKDRLHVYLDGKIIPGADPSTFEFINEVWAKDRKSYFFKGKLISYIDYATFQYLDYNYAKDKNHVYYDDEIIKGADSKSFVHIDGSQDGRDKNGCYHYGEKVNCSNLGKD